MKLHNYSRRNQNGQALVTALIFLLSLTFLGFGLVTMSTMDIHTARNYRLSEEALSAAEEGVMFGMAWASYPDTEFANKMPGEAKDVSSYANSYRNPAESRQFETNIMMIGPADPPAGTAIGKGGATSTEAEYVNIRVISTGMVSEAPKGVFDFTKKPMIRRTLEVYVKVKKK